MKTPAIPEKQDLFTTGHLLFITVEQGTTQLGNEIVQVSPGKAGYLQGSLKSWKKGRVLITVKNIFVK